MVLGRERLARWDAPAESDRAELVRCRGHVVAPGRDHRPRLLERVEDRADHHLRADRVRLELERRHHAEVAPRATHRPEQVLVLGRARPSQLPVGGDDVDRQQIVDREPILPPEMADAPVQGQSADARGGDHAARNRQAMKLRLPVAVAPGCAALCADDSGGRIDVHAAHLRQVDHQAVVVDGVTGDVVAAALDRQGELVLAGEVDRVDDVRRARALDDHRRPSVDQPVPDRPRLVVAVLSGPQNPSADPRDEGVDRFRVEARHGGWCTRHSQPPLAVFRRPLVSTLPSIRTLRPSGCRVRQHRPFVSPIARRGSRSGRCR